MALANLLRVVVLLCVHAAVAADEEPNKLSLWPMPSTAKLLDPACIAISSDTFRYKTGATSAILQAALSRYTALTFLPGAPQQPCTPPEAARHGGHLHRRASMVATAARLTELTIVLQSSDETLGPHTVEHYTLVVAPPVPTTAAAAVNATATATLTAATVFGALRGLETFAQLVFGGGKEGAGAGAAQVRVLPAVSIEDSPRFGYRAIMVDTARLFRPVPLLERMMDAMAATKLNALYLHLTDVGCWTLEVKSYPLLATNCSKGCTLDGTAATGHQSYTQDDIRGLVAYGTDRGIRIIPEIDSPGHFDTAACYPELLTVADYPCPGAGPGKGTFHGPPDPSSSKLWEFFTALYRELGGLFPDPYVSLGGDESWLTPWSCSPAVVQWMAAHNLGSLSAAAAWYERHLYAIVNATPGKQTMMWAPGEQAVANTTVHLVWSGWPQNGPVDAWKGDVAKFTGLRQPVVLSGPWYLDPHHPEWDGWQQWYHTDPGNFSATFPWQQGFVLGGMGTIWSDLVKADIIHQAWPLMNAVAEQLWSPATRTRLPGAPTARYMAQCARLQQRGILNATGCNAPPPAPPPPPPPPPSPPPSPVACTPHVGAKLNNTQYADGNGPRTTVDADSCCQLCAHTGNCAHWSFQIDPTVAGKTCKWATLTYCCWMHSAATNPITQAGWTSDVAPAPSVAVNTTGGHAFRSYGHAFTLSPLA